MLYFLILKRLELQILIYISNVLRGVPGSIPGSGNSAHFYCGNSSDSLFWNHHGLKYMSSMQNLECKIFYVNRSSGPCERGSFGIMSV